MRFVNLAHAVARTREIQINKVIYKINTQTPFKTLQLVAHDLARARARLTISIRAEKTNEINFPISQTASVCWGLINYLLVRSKSNGVENERAGGRRRPFKHIGLFCLCLEGGWGVGVGARRERQVYIFQRNSVRKTLSIVVTR